MSNGLISFMLLLIGSGLSLMSVFFFVCVNLWDCVIWWLNMPHDVLPQAAQVFKGARWMREPIRSIDLFCIQAFMIFVLGKNDFGRWNRMWPFHCVHTTVFKKGAGCLCAAATSEMLHLHIVVCICCYTKDFTKWQHFCLFPSFNVWTWSLLFSPDLWVLTALMVEPKIRAKREQRLDSRSSGDNSTPHEPSCCSVTAGCVNMQLSSSTST